MELTLDNHDGEFKIKSYEKGVLTINETEYKESIILFPDEIVSPWPPKRTSDILNADFANYLTSELDIVIIGTGARLSFPEPSNYLYLIENNIGYEFMDSGAAARTYSILMAESRKFAACIIV